MKIYNCLIFILLTTATTYTYGCLAVYGSSQDSTNKIRTFHPQGYYNSSAAVYDTIISNSLSNFDEILAKDLNIELDAIYERGRLYGFGVLKKQWPNINYDKHISIFYDLEYDADNLYMANSEFWDNVGETYDILTDYDFEERNMNYTYQMLSGKTEQMYEVLNNAEFQKFITSIPGANIFFDRIIYKDNLPVKSVRIRFVTPLSPLMNSWMPDISDTHPVVQPNDSITNRNTFR